MLPPCFTGKGNGCLTPVVRKPAQGQPARQWQSQDWNGHLLNPKAYIFFSLSQAGSLRA